MVWAANDWRHAFCDDDDDGYYYNNDDDYEDYAAEEECELDVCGEWWAGSNGQQCNQASQSPAQLLNSASLIRFDKGAPITALPDVTKSQARAVNLVDSSVFN